MLADIELGPTEKPLSVVRWPIWSGTWSRLVASWLATASALSYQTLSAISPVTAVSNRLARIGDQEEIIRRRNIDHPEIDERAAARGRSSNMKAVGLVPAPASTTRTPLKLKIAGPTRLTVDGSRTGGGADDQPVGRAGAEADIQAEPTGATADEGGANVQRIADGTVAKLDRAAIGEQFEAIEDRRPADGTDNSSVGDGNHCRRRTGWCPTHRKFRYWRSCHCPR